MKARSSERTMENSALIGRGGLLSVARERRRFRRTWPESTKKAGKPAVSVHPSRPTTVICASNQSTIDKRLLSMVKPPTTNHTM